MPVMDTLPCMAPGPSPEDGAKPVPPPQAENARAVIIMTVNFKNLSMKFSYFANILITLYSYPYIEGEVI
jgi:hypothetical protein